MKIVHIIFSLNTGGAETMLVDIINEQIKTQQVHLLVINNSVNPNLLENVNDNVNVNLIGRKEGSKNIFPILKLNVLLFKIRPDVIHCHHQAIIKFLFKPTNPVLTVHGLGITAKNFNKYQKIFAISKAVKKDIESRSNVKLTVVYNGINTEEIQIKEDSNFDVFRIVQVGRLNHLMKGQHLLIEALNIIVNKKGIKNIIVDFIGEALFPEMYVFLQKKVTKLKLDGFVRFLGNKERTFVYNHLKDYNLLIQPSLNEGFGLTIVEAMAAKLPILISDIDGPMEIISNGVYGAYFEKNNIEELSEKIIEIITNYKESIKKTELAKLHVNNEFTVKKMVDNYNSNY